MYETQPPDYDAEIQAARDRGDITNVIAWKRAQHYNTQNTTETTNDHQS